MFCISGICISDSDSCSNTDPAGFSYIVAFGFVNMFSNSAGSGAGSNPVGAASASLILGGGTSGDSDAGSTGFFSTSTGSGGGGNPVRAASAGLILGEGTSGASDAGSTGCSGGAFRAMGSASCPLDNSGENVGVVPWCMAGASAPFPDVAESLAAMLLAHATGIRLEHPGRFHSDRYSGGGSTVSNERKGGEG